MAITFSCPNNSTILSIWGENMHLGASARALRYLELFGQEKVMAILNFFLLILVGIDCVWG